MSADFVKVYPGFFKGSLVDTPPYARLLFLAMISQADHCGVALGTVGFWARYAGITEEQARESIRILSSPDPESTSPEEEGRRILPYGEGANRWLIVNYQRYYEKGRNEDRKEQKREWDRLNRSSGHKRKKSDTVRPNPTQSVQSDPESESESESESEKKEKTPKASMRLTPLDLLPVDFQTSELREAYKRYDRMRIEKKIRPWTATTVKERADQWGRCEPSQVLAALQKSVSNGWQGVFPERELPSTAAVDDRERILSNLRAEGYE